MFLFRPEYYAAAENRHEVEGKAELIISKQRNAHGVVPLFFHKAYTRFDSVVAEPPGATRLQVEPETALARDQEGRRRAREWALLYSGWLGSAYGRCSCHP